MRKVTLQYRPIPFLRFTRLKTGNFPTEWSEIDPKQFIAIACLSKVALPDLTFLHIMTKLPKRLLRKLDDYQRFKLIQLFEIFQGEKPFNDFIIQKIDCGAAILYAPKPQLDNVTFGQFIFMDSYFSNYQEKADAIELNKFIASAYLPYGQRFTEFIIEANHQYIASLDLLTKEALIINYQLIRDWLSKVYPLVFDVQEQSKVEGEKSKTPKRNPNSWIQVFENIVGDDIANEDKYANLPFHTAMRYLTNKIKQNA